MEKGASEKTRKGGKLERERGPVRGRG